MRFELGLRLALVLLFIRLCEDTSNVFLQILSKNHLAYAAISLQSTPWTATRSKEHYGGCRAGVINGKSRGDQDGARSGTMGMMNNNVAGGDGGSRGSGPA